MKKESLQFDSAFKGKVIHAVLFEPDTNVRGLVQIIHGFAEHIGRYEKFMRFLAEHGYVAFGDDHLGHGITAKQNGMNLSDVGSYDALPFLLEDEWKLNQLIRERYGTSSVNLADNSKDGANTESAPETSTLPCYILGHSMGSLMLRALLFEYPDICDKAVIMGTGDMSLALLKVFGGILNISEFWHKGDYRSKLINFMAIGKNNAPFRSEENPNSWISANRENITKYAQDELTGEMGSLYTFHFLQRLMTVIRQKENLLKMHQMLPILLVSGAEDAFGEMGKGPRNVFNLFQDAGMKDVRLVLYPGMRHEVLNEKDYASVSQDLLDFFEK